MEYSWKPHEPLPVEETMNNFITSVGGILVSEIVGSSPNFENADYLFDNQKVVIELKEIETEFSKSINFEKNHAFIRTFNERGSNMASIIIWRK